MGKWKPEEQSRNKSPHEIERKSNADFMTMATQKKPRRQPDTTNHKENVYTLNLVEGVTDTPEFNQDPNKFVYNCQQIYALLESVKIERNHEDSIELVSQIRDSIRKLSNESSLKREVEELQRLLWKVEQKLRGGFPVPKGTPYVPPSLLSSSHHQIEISLVSNWKETTGKEIVYTNFSLFSNEDLPLQDSIFKEQSYQIKTTATQQSLKFHRSRNSTCSNIRMSDLNLEIEMLDSLLEGKLGNKKPRMLHTSTVSSETIRKCKPLSKRDRFY